VVEVAIMQKLKRDSARIRRERRSTCRSKESKMRKKIMHLKMRMRLLERKEKECLFME
jgi:hypothetical protein